MHDLTHHSVRMMHYLALEAGQSLSQDTQSAQFAQQHGVRERSTAYLVHVFTRVLQSTDSNLVTELEAAS